MKLILGLLVAFSVGAVCRVFGLPAPSPTSLIGVLLVGAMTLGYMTVERMKGPNAQQVAPSPAASAAPGDTRASANRDASGR